MDKQIFYNEMQKLIPLISREFIRRQAKNVEKKNITPSQMLILEFINLKKRVIMKEIAKKLKISTPAVTGLVDRLEKMKLLKRVRDEKDRRAINIEITEQGKQIAKKISDERINTLKALFDVLSDKERDEYIKITRKITQNIKGN